MDLENRRWLRLMWNARRYPNSPFSLRPGFWKCVAGTIALLLNRYDEKLLEGYVYAEECNDVAFTHAGYYNTDFGTGEAFEFLRVVGFSFAVGSDGSL